MKGTTSLILGALLVAGLSLALACCGTVNPQIEAKPAVTATLTAQPTERPARTSTSTAMPTATRIAAPRWSSAPRRRVTGHLCIASGHVPARVSRSITIARFYSAPKGPSRTHPASWRPAENP